MTKLQIDACFAVPFWNSAWGAVPSREEPPTRAFLSTWIPPGPSDKVESAVGPRVLSLEGYGVAENEVFALSAWIGLFLMLFCAFLFWTPLTTEEREQHDDGASDPLVFRPEKAISQFAIENLFTGTNEIKTDPVPNFKMLAKMQDLANKL